MIKCVQIILDGKEDNINKAIKYIEKINSKISIENDISIEIDGSAKISKEWLDMRKRIKKNIKIYDKQIQNVEDMKKREGIK